MLQGICEKTNSISILCCASSFMLQELKEMDGFRPSRGVRADRTKAVICTALALTQLISWLRLKSSVFAQSLQSPGWKMVRSSPFLLWGYRNWGLVSIYAKHPKTYGFVPFSARWRTSSPLPLPSLQTQKKTPLKGSMVFTIKIHQPPLADRIYRGKVVVIWSNINPGWPP